MQGERRGGQGVGEQPNMRGIVGGADERAWQGGERWDAHGRGRLEQEGRGGVDGGSGEGSEEGNGGGGNFSIWFKRRAAPVIIIIASIAIVSTGPTAHAWLSSHLRLRIG